MKLINKLDFQPYQRAFLTGNPGQRIIMDLRFMPTLEQWVANFTLGDFSVKGIPIVCSLNILRNFKNIIPFGVLVTTTDGQDPRGLTDFESQYLKMYLLSQEEVEEIEVTYFE